MNFVMPEGLLLIGVVAWPLVVACLLLTPGLKSTGRVLAPWAALPALVLAIFPDISLQLRGVMLGSSLSLDATGRVFIFVLSLLWLASGVLMHVRLSQTASNGMGVFLLLAMAGNFALVLAADALLFFAAATISGYSLYGAIVYESDKQTRKGGRVLVALLVFSDLLIFEVLLILAHAAGAVDFVSLRQAFVNLENDNLVLGLLIAGMGVKLGLLGVHFWVSRVFARAGVELRPAIMAFIFGAGMLGGLRLLPLGQIEASGAASILQWLAWLTLIYAFLFGVAHIYRRAIPGYVVIALSSVWLSVLSVSLHQPVWWGTLATPFAAVLIQSAVSLAAILLINQICGRVSSRRFNDAVSFLAGLSVFMLSMAPLGLIGVIDGQATIIAILAAMAVIAVLSYNSVFQRDLDCLSESLVEDAPSLALSVSYSKKAAIFSFWVSAVLLAVAMIVMAYQLLHVTITVVVISILTVLAAILMSLVNTNWQLFLQPVFAPVDRPIFPVHRLRRLSVSIQRRLTHSMQRWVDTTQALGRRAVLNMKLNDINVFIESVLHRWSLALSLLLLLGLLIAWLASS